jgi:predicted regulator of Ras-like GTPase activity (Roadblock/LC7/MglB family)
VDAQHALADLAEISSQIQAAVVFDEKGEVAGSTLSDGARAKALADRAAQLFAEAEQVRAVADSPLKQVEAATAAGSVFVVADGTTRIAATTAPKPTVGLVFYDLKSALRSIEHKPAPKKRAAPKKKGAARKKKTDDAA